MMNNIYLNVHSIDSFGTHDGPGIRLVVFLQGCNLKCKYCQNPDSISKKETSKFISVNEILKRARRMKPYFKNGGGVTLSGGEPMLQSKEIIALFDKLKKYDIHTNIDTNGTVITKDAQLLIRTQADLIMFDVKHTNNMGFSSLTGANRFTNLLKNVQLREESKKPYWLRYVLVPGYTDSDESLYRLIDLFSNKNYLEKLEILPYHKLGMHKWEMLNWEYELADVEENTQEQLERVDSILNK
ncbi:MAG: pyruvate formate-lyase-activating protein, partial [Bacteroidales bacterium]|nr:pyruvate formate-lyase-activating protein [Bacteroidales bacterium]